MDRCGASGISDNSVPTAASPVCSPEEPIRIWKIARVNAAVSRCGNNCSSPEGASSRPNCRAGRCWQCPHVPESRRPSDLHYWRYGLWYDGVAEVARRSHVGVVLLLAVAAQTRGSFHLTMNTNGAIETAHAFPDAMIVPFIMRAAQIFT